MAGRCPAIGRQLYPAIRLLIRMHKLLKAGILIVLLVLPASVFLFLRGFGKNHYTVRTYYPLIDSGTGEPIIRKKIEFDREVNDTLFHQIPAFSLIDQNGKQVTSAITENKIYVANFIFTRCTSICPKMSTELSRVQEAFLNQPNVLLLSHTVDPENDTPDIIKAYAAEYKAIPAKWYFLTGDKGAIYQLAQKGYKIPAVDLSSETQSPEDMFIHSEKLVLVDQNRHIRGYYDGTDPKEVDRLVLETKILLREIENE
jgi:protein SCO1/2